MSTTMAEEKALAELFGRAKEVRVIESGIFVVTDYQNATICRTRWPVMHCTPMFGWAELQAAIQGLSESDDDGETAS